MFQFLFISAHDHIQGYWVYRNNWYRTFLHYMVYLVGHLHSEIEILTRNMKVIKRKLITSNETEILFLYIGLLKVKHIL